MLVIPISSIGWIAYQRLNENSLESSYGQTKTILNEIRQDILSFEKTTLSNLKLFSNDSLLHKYVTSDEEYRYDLILPTLLKVFGSYQKAYNEYYEIRIILPDGYEDTRKTNRTIDNITEEELNTSIFKKMISSGKRMTSFYTTNPDNNEYAFYASAPLILKNKSVDGLSKPPELRAFLALTISLDWLSNKLNNTVIGSNGYVFITDKNGSILFGNEKHSLLAGTNITQPFDNNEQYINQLLNNETPDLNHLLKTKHSKGYLWSSPVSEDLIVFAWQPNADITENSVQLGIRIFVIATLSILIFSFLLFNLFNRVIITPIKRLEESAKAIGRGDLKETISIDTKDEIGSLANSFNQMSENLQRSNDQISYLAYHDDLTGLPNRLMFHEYASQAVHTAKRNNQRLSIIYIDLDNFKRVNDTMGHKAGDTLLKKVSDRILGCLRESDYAARTDDEIDDIAARIGGDEFLLLLHDIPDNFLPGKVAERIITALSQPVIITGNEFYVSASLGITIYPDDSTTAEDLIKHADMAMYHAKSVGKNNFQYFLESMNSSMLKRMKLENKLRNAIAENNLYLQYQPQIDTVTGKIYGVEALVRWHDPEEGMIAPDIFIPIAEETGLIIEIGEYVLKEACEQARHWHSINSNPITVSVNVSAIQFNKINMPELISKVLDQTGLDARYLDIEITESVIMEDIDRVSKTLNQIRSLGCAISLDDFGTGYSSLNYLRKFPIDILKIDRSFVSEIDPQNEDKGAIIVAIISMSHALNLEVIAEGIETQDQLDKMIEWKCDYIQGFLLHRPLNAEDIDKLLSNNEVTIKKATLTG